MADYYYGGIEFPVKALEVEEIATEVEELEKHTFTEYEKYQGVYIAHANEARYGYFQDLEPLLTKHGFPYKRESGTYGDEAPFQNFSDPVDDVNYGWHLSSIGGVKLAAVNEIISNLKTALSHEDEATALENAKEFLRSLEQQYPDKEVSQFVTSFEGTITPAYSTHVTSDIILYATRPHNDLIFYQCEVVGKLGLVYKAKPIYITVDGIERCTFFTEGGKQYWIDEMNDALSISYGG